MLVWVQVPSPADAEVAELADAHGSGPCGSNTLWVRLPSSAYLLTAGSLNVLPAVIFAFSSFYFNRSRKPPASKS